ncbi:MAG: Mut7-C ubiquitin/RNAse domain-containing protein [Chloroflexi bacterium]|nr:Mut7-C ubiquitin/RNAse domain-containing protein [Chloroflexota bacterium]
MLPICIRFYGSLNDFLPAHRRQMTFTVTLNEPASVKHVIEMLGVPHTEVDLILVNGISVDFVARLSGGERVAVYPRFTRLDVEEVSRVRPPAPETPRFVLDTHLGKLAEYLRMLGFDTLYRNDYPDDVLATISAEDGRLLLTRDRGLLKRSIVSSGYLVRADAPRAQVAEVVRRFDLSGRAEPFRRCLRCNSRLESVSKADIFDQLQPKTRRYYDEFARCPGCGRIYWKGSHYERMRRFLAGLPVGRMPAGAADPASLDGGHPRGGASRVSHPSNEIEHHADAAESP